MSFEVLFNGTAINEDAIMGLSYEADLFDGNFTLGSTVCKVVHLDVEKSEVTLRGIPDLVTIVDFPSYCLTMRVDSWELNDEGYYSFTLTDKMVDFNVVYDWSVLADQSLQNILDNMCTDILATPAPIITYMGDLELTWNQNTQARDVISYIAEVNGCFARINEFEELEFVPFSNTPTNTIDVETCEDFSYGEEIIIDRVVYESGVATSKYPDDDTYTGTHSTLYINPDNFLLTDSQGYTRDGIVQHIYTLVNGLHFCSLETSRCEINPSVQAGDCIKFTLGNSEYYTFAQIDWKYNGAWYGGYKLDVETKKQEETSVGGLSASIDRRVTIVVDRELGVIQQEIAELTTDVENSIATITYLYGYGTSATTHPADSAFTHSTMPPLVDGTYIWRKTTFTDNDGDATYQYEMIQGVGEDGIGVSELQELHYQQSPQPKTVTGNVVAVDDAVLTEPMSLTTSYEINQDLAGQTEPFLYGSKNILYNNVYGTKEINGITAVFRNDGSILINGKTTATTMLVYNFALEEGGTSAGQNDMKKHIPNGTYTVRSFSSSVSVQVQGANGSGTGTQIFSNYTGTLTIDDTYAYNWVRLYIGSGKTFSNANIRPMIIDVNEDSSTYTPSRNICPIIPQTSETYRIGGHNLMHYTLDDIKALNTAGTWVDNEYTRYDVSFTVEENGEITIYGSLSTGTSTSFDIPVPSYLGGDFIFAGFWSQTGSSTKWQAYVRDNTTATRVKKWDGTTNSDYMRSGGGYQIKLVKGDKNVIRIVVYSGNVISNLKFSPMIKRKEETTYDVYYPKDTSVATNIPFEDSLYEGTFEEVSGTLTHTYGVISSTWGQGTNATVIGSYTRKGFGHALDIDTENRNNSYSNCAEMVASFAEDSNHFYFSSPDFLYVFLPNETPSDFPIQVVYPLAEETTSQADANRVALNTMEYQTLLAEGSNVSLVYAYNATVSPPSSQVTTINPFPDIWTLGFPPYQDGSRYWYCLQSIMTDNSVQWSTPMLDGTSNEALQGVDNLADTVSNIRVETSANVQILSDRISDVVSRTEVIEENYINAETLENTLVEKQVVTSSELTQTADNITASFTNYVRKDDKDYVDLTTNIVFDADGINIGSSTVDTNLQLSADGVAFKDGSNNVIASMTPTEFTTGEWVMNQSTYVFNIFRRHS